MSAIEARPETQAGEAVFMQERVEVQGLFNALNRAYKAYERGRDPFLPALVLYREMDAVAEEEESARGWDPILLFAQDDNLNSRVDTSSHSVFQARTSRLDDSRSPMASTFRDFEAPVNTQRNNTRAIRNRQKQLGFFYFHMAGVMAIGDQTSGIGFADESPDLKGMLTADYLYHRGLLMLQKYMYGSTEDGQSIDPWEIERKRRGYDKASDQRKKEIIDGMWQDTARMEQSIIHSRIIVHQAWLGFYQAKEDLLPSERDLTEGVIESYDRQFSVDRASDRPLGVDFTTFNPMTPFVTSVGVENHRSVNALLSVLGISRDQVK